MNQLDNHPLSIAEEVATLLARETLYQFCSLSLRDPRSGSFQQLDLLRSTKLVDQACELVRNELANISLTLGAGESPLSALRPDDVMAKLPSTSDELNRQFERTFGLLSGSACPPYETEYIDGKQTFQRSNTMADVAGFYRAFGWHVNPARRERPDHIALQLEFLARLLTLERAALQSGSRSMNGQADICQRAQIRFLREHLAWWAGGFCKLLGTQCPGMFYGAVATFLGAFVAAERARLAVPASTGVPAPTLIESPEACDGCSLAALDLD